MAARRNLPSIKALVTFEAAMRLKSFTGAARELNVTQAAVSRQIQAIDAWNLARKVAEEKLVTSPSRLDREAAQREVARWVRSPRNSAPLLHSTTWRTGLSARSPS